MAENYRNLPGYDWKCLEIAGHFCKLLEMARKDWKLLELAVKYFKTTGNNWKWLEMT